MTRLQRESTELRTRRIKEFQNRVSSDERLASESINQSPEQERLSSERSSTDARPRIGNYDLTLEQSATLSVEHGRWSNRSHPAATLTKPANSAAGIFC